MFQLTRSRTWVPAFCRAAIRPFAFRIDSDSRIEVRLTSNCEASSISRGSVMPSCQAPVTIRLAISRAHMVARLARFDVRLGNRESRVKKYCLLYCDCDVKSILKSCVI